MKVSLVVASGVHQGKVIPITTPQFLIGRDPQCQLRPASQAVSKQHCALVVRDGKVFVRDFGSTNGTLVNDALVQNEERAVVNNDTLKIGPLDFTIRIEVPAPAPDGTPLPDTAAVAAVKAVAAAAAAAAPKAPPRDATPAPGSKESSALPGSKVHTPLKSGSKESPALKTGSKESPALPAQPKPADPTISAGTGDTAESADDHDKIAAMLLGLADGDVPQGSTVMDMPSPLAGEQTAAAKPEEKKDTRKETTREEMSNAANEILRKMMRRPK